MQYSNIILTVILCLCIKLIFAQENGRVSGTVKDKNGTPIGSATVALRGTLFSTLTDDDGNYELSAPEGEYTLTVSGLGYSVFQTSLSLKKEKTPSYDVTLNDAETVLDEVNVDGKSQSQELRESAWNVNSLAIRELANSTLDLNQVLNRSTGINVREDGGIGSDFDFSINGLSGKAVKFFIDGIPMESFGGTMTLNNIPVNLAERVDVFKGVVPVELGADALGGAVNIVTNQSPGNYLDASYSIGSFSTHRMAVNGQVNLPKTDIVVKFNSFANYSDNSYLMRGVEWYDADLKKYVTKDFNRFHDRFFSAFGLVEAGVMNKKWADVFMLGVGYSLQNKDIQTGATQNILYGAARRIGSTYTGSIRYKKENLFASGLDFNLYASLSEDDYKVIDTSYRHYFWDGSYQETNRAEMSRGPRAIWQYERPTNVLRTNLNYRLSESHTFNLNYQLNDFHNSVYNTYTENDATEDQITKHIAGLAYQQILLREKLSNTFFFKYYGIALTTQLDTEDAYFDPYFAGDIANANGTVTNYGYGAASRYRFGEGNLGVKASYEHAYRLQEPSELLGDGVNVMPNFNLRPESSDNYNLGIYWGKTITPKHRIFAEGSVFYRDMRDYIQGIYREALGITQFQNTSSVLINGFESEIRYTYAQLLNLRLNASYQNAVNTTVIDGRKEITHGYKLPNRPWIFGNADLGIGKNGVLGRDTRLEFMWSTQYVHWFYLSWANFGDPNHKSVIPTQLIHNALVSASFGNGKYNVSLECKNLGDNLAYDNYKLQKPGRAFHTKVRVFIN